IITLKPLKCSLFYNFSVELYSHHDIKNSFFENLQSKESDRSTQQFQISSKSLDFGNDLDKSELELMDSDDLLLEEDFQKPDYSSFSKCGEKTRKKRPCANCVCVCLLKFLQLILTGQLDLHVAV
ncbi:MAG: Anamorsin, partial [Paramarteilia canceri]